ncbi:hypothetical protein [Bradyrhizobium sp. CCBAU 45384]|uniref:hypothetical protein n=1 Tax=Bradyrhizobium sp. CCBAU 45384 TaxID=858428 RepID=UPI0023066DD8|nr:hypothetical protein [Bradyrhizobium sp. CCBAU 45384]
MGRESAITIVGTKQGLTGGILRLKQKRPSPSQQQMNAKRRIAALSLRPGADL